MTFPEQVEGRISTAGECILICVSTYLDLLWDVVEENELI